MGREQLQGRPGGEGGSLCQLYGLSFEVPPSCASFLADQGLPLTPSSTSRLTDRPPPGPAAPSAPSPLPPGRLTTPAGITDPGPDVRISRGPVPEPTQGTLEYGLRYVATADRFLLAMDGVARYLVEEGRIVIDPDPTASSDVVGIFLLGSAVGALLHLRRMLPLHASAIALPGDRCALFLGPSGIGKSTMAAVLAGRGYPVVTDDISVVTVDGNGVPRLRPGPPRMKLWADTAKRLGKEPAALRRVQPEKEKFSVPLEPGRSLASSSSPVVCHIVELCLDDAREPVLSQPIVGLEKMQMLLRNTYRLYFMEGVGDRTPHFQLCASVASKARFRCLRRDNDISRLEELADLMQRVVES